MSKLAAPRIHPTAVVDPDATIADDVTVGPYCVIGPKVSIGPGTTLSHHVSIDGRTTLGRDNRIFPFASIGAEPQDRKFFGEDSRLEIGDGNTVRECVTLNLGTENGGGVTRIGSNNILMACSHVAHDCILEDDITMANGVLLGGHIRIASNVILSGGALVHHFVTIGRHAFIAGGAHVNVDAPPFMMVHGVKQKVHNVNVVGLKRHGFSKEALDALREAHRIVWRSGAVKREAIRRLEHDFAGVPEIPELAAFLNASLDGKNGRALEAHRKDV